METVIFAAVAIAIVILFSPRQQPFKTESLLLAVLIFGIYLIVFKKIKDFKFSDFEVRLTDAENKPLLESSSISMPFEDDAHSYFETAKSGGGTEKLEKDVLPKLLREARKINVFKIKQEVVLYGTILFDYMKYFSYIVLLNKEDKLSGFMVQNDIEKLLKMDDKDKNQFIDDLNNWNINKYPVRKDAYIVKGTSRKQVLETMKNLDSSYERAS